MNKAFHKDIVSIVDFYSFVIDEVNKTDINLGWDINIYPGLEFVQQMVSSGSMYIFKENDRIIAAAAVNHSMNPEYDSIDWNIKHPKSRICSIHAFAVSPEFRGSLVSDRFLEELENLCRSNGDVALHLDVIDTNIPALHLYQRNGYNIIDSIPMYYECVGTRNFWMLEKIL